MPPLCVMVKPASSMCNMRCAYCFYADVAQSRSVQSFGAMRRETLETLVRRAFAYAEGYVQFVFQGGEPTLLGADFFRDAVALQKKYNARNLPVTNAVQTNGYALTDEIISCFAENGFLVGVSLDGDRDVHDLYRKDAQGRGTFDRVTENIDRLLRAGCDVNILSVVHEGNARRARETFLALSKYKYLQFIPCLDALSGEKGTYSLSASSYAGFLGETFSLYYEAWKGGDYVSVRAFDNWVGMLMGRPPESCGMTGKCGAYFLIEGDGSVYPCDFYVLDRWRMGNINDASFAKLAKSPVQAEFIAQSLPAPDACRACEWVHLCRNGCKRERGETDINRFCEAYREFFPNAIDRMREMARKAAQNQTT
ncbi:MAG: radical SAM protein [Christensenellales bacterium]|jgi:uncharacterized protein